MNNSEDNPVYERDARGLVKGIIYHFTPEGRIDWRRMVDARFLYITNEFKDKACQEQGKPLAELDLMKVNEKWLRMTIGGINQLANLRGYMSLEYPHVHVTDSCVTATCAMQFIGNFETEGDLFVCSAIASANMWNVDKDFTSYLATFAENRAFSRCVKRALQINILSDVEIGGDGRKNTNITGAVAGESSDSTPAAGFEPLNVLESKCKASSITFEAVKAAALKYETELKSKPNEWKGFADIQAIDAWLILSKMEAKDSKLKKA